VYIVHVLNDGLFERAGRSLVGCVFVVALLDFGGGGVEGEEGQEVVDDVILGRG
jgi:hypothetical protein